MEGICSSRWIVVQRPFYEHLLQETLSEFLWTFDCSLLKFLLKFSEFREEELSENVLWIFWECTLEFRGKFLKISEEDAWNLKKVLLTSRKTFLSFRDIYLRGVDCPGHVLHTCGACTLNVRGEVIWTSIAGFCSSGWILVQRVFYEHLLQRKLCGEEFLWTSERSFLKIREKWQMEFLWTSGWNCLNFRGKIFEISGEILWISGFARLSGKFSELLWIEVLCSF